MPIELAPVSKDTITIFVSIARQLGAYGTFECILGLSTKDEVTVEATSERTHLAVTSNQLLIMERLRCKA